MTAEWAMARTWLEIDLDSIAANYRHALSELSPGVAHYAVLKADAYGLGAAPIARRLYAEGSRLFAVACAAEALALWDALPEDADILIMGMTMPPEMEAVAARGIIPAVQRMEEARAFSEIAERLGRSVRVQCKVDTGLNRLGFSTAEAPEAIAEIARMPGLLLQGVFSHLQRRSKAHDRMQAQRLLAVDAAVRARGVDGYALHLLDSIGMWRYPAFQMDAVRNAAYLFGHTMPGYAHPERLEQAMAFKTRIVRIHDAVAGECLGYDGAHPLKTDRRVATLCVGFADGYPRGMSHRGEVVIRGKRAKLLGVVCMDLVMVDVSGIPEAEVGDVATLLGGGIDVWEYAALCGGYHNECLTRIAPRVPRVYLKGGKVCEILSGMPGPLHKPKEPQHEI